MVWSSQIVVCNGNRIHIFHIMDRQSKGSLKPPNIGKETKWPPSPRESHTVYWAIAISKNVSVWIFFCKVGNRGYFIVNLNGSCRIF